MITVDYDFIQPFDDESNRNFLESDIDELRGLFSIKLDMLIDGASVFPAYRHSDGSVGGEYGCLLDFALTYSYAMHEAIETGSSDLDPYESGPVLLIRRSNSELAIESRPLKRTFVVSIEDAKTSVKTLNDRARAFLLGLSPRMDQHPQFGDWIRGEREYVVYDDFERLGSWADLN
jgi:hypothetical protein